MHAIHYNFPHNFQLCVLYMKHKVDAINNLLNIVEEIDIKDNLTVKNLCYIHRDAQPNKIIFI